MHEVPITLNGWTGSGYTMLDPDYGVGGYMISGGESGRWIKPASIAINVATSMLAIMGAAFALGKISFNPILASLLAYVGLLITVYELAASCGLAAIPWVLGATAFTFLAIYIGFQAGGLIGLNLALQVASVTIGSVLSGLSSVCRGE